MTPPKKDEWSSWFYFADRYGLPLVALVVVCGAIWKIASWVAPKADLVIDTHVKSISRLVDVSEQQATTLGAMEATATSTAKQIDEIHRAIIKPKEVAGGNKQ
jgi:hypothetical protein